MVEDRKVDSAAPAELPAGVNSSDSKQPAANAGGMGVSEDALQKGLQFDFEAFLYVFSYVLFFPFSEVVRRVMSGSPIALASWGLSITMTAYWTYAIVFFSVSHSNLNVGEPFLPLVFVIILAIDTSISLSSPTLSRKMDAIKTFTQRYREAKSKLDAKTKFGLFMNVLAQLISITPIEEHSIHNRELMASYGIELSLHEDTTDEDLEQWTLLDYDLRENDADVQEALTHLNADTDAGGAGGGADGGPGLARSGTLLRESLFLVALPDHIGLELGPSYQRQARQQPRKIQLVNVADQIIWGVKKRKRMCSGMCGRFWSVDKLPSVLVAIVYIVFVSGLPAFFRFYNNDVDELNGIEWVLTIAYVVLTVSLSFQVCVFFILIIEIYKYSYERMDMLNALLSEEEAKAYCLPVLKFEDERDVLAWVALRQYVTGFSAKTALFLGQRLTVFALAILGCLFYMLAQESRGRLRDAQLFTAFTVATFLVFLFFFLVVVAFGVLSNITMVDIQTRISSKLMLMHERQFMARLGLQTLSAEAVKRVENMRQSLNDLLVFLGARPPVSLLGMPLDSALVGIIGTGLITVAGFVAPILAQAFGAD